jgi:hypothetical protein
MVEPPAVPPLREIERATSALAAVYGGDEGAYARDLELFRRYYVAMARLVGEKQVELMGGILSRVADRYLESGEAVEAQMMRLTRGIRAWLPFVSFSYFVPILEELEPLRRTEPLRQSREAPSLPERLSDPDLDSDVTGEPEIQRLLEDAEAEAVNLERWTDWRGLRGNEPPSSARQLGLASFARDLEGTTGGDTALRAFLYEEFPVLLVLPRVCTPGELAQLIQLPRRDRDQGLCALIRRAATPLRASWRAVVRELQQDTEAIAWERFRPILEAAKLALVGPAEPETSLHRLADSIASRMIPWSWQDTISLSLIVVSLGLVVATAGFPPTVVLAADVITSVSATGAIAYLNMLENEPREQLNRFARIDAALAVASPPLPVASELVLLALSYAIGPMVAAGLRWTRETIARRMATTVSAVTADAGAVRAPTTRSTTSDAPLRLTEPQNRGTSRARSLRTDAIEAERGVAARGTGAGAEQAMESRASSEISEAVTRYLTEAHRNAVRVAAIRRRAAMDGLVAVTARRDFREWAIDAILSVPQHPLLPLLDETTGDFVRSTSGHWNVLYNTEVPQMGHLAAASLDPNERMALQWAYSNQVQRIAEQRGIVIERMALNIEGIPVEADYADLLVRRRVIPARLVRDAPEHLGWRLSDWTTEPGQVRGVWVWIRTGGAGQPTVPH